MTGFYDDGIRAGLKTMGIQNLRWLRNGRDQVSSTAYPLRQNHIRRLANFQTANGRKQIVELAAETGAGYFFDIEALLPQRVRVHQIGRLIIGDNADLQP